jgi:signal transduction histidine kinase/FixJ family two-component response regulator
LLVIIGVALVLALGYLAYTSMSSILQSVTRESKPDLKLTMIKMLATDLEQAGNSVRLYAYSHDERDLRPYYDLVTGIDAKISELDYAGQGSPEFSAYIDTISSLVEQKILIWNEMLPLYTVKQAEVYLDTISKELENKMVSDSLRKSRNIFKKIFQRQEKVDLDEQKMIRDIEQARQVDSARSLQIRNKELRLAEASSRLTQQFYDLVKRMEVSDYRSRREKAAEADMMAAETYRWIGWFSLSATLSLLLVIFIITRYIRRSHTYQQALVRARNEAETLAKAKEMFVANVSHELRTPMNVISGFVNQLLKKPQNEENEETLKIIKSSSDHLVRIVNDILDFSKLESGKMVLEPVNFHTGAIFNELMLLFQNSVREKDIRFEVEVGEEVPEYLYGDSIRLKQILINLAGNAIKFTEKGSVKISVQAENQVAGHLDLKIAVADTGIGIAQDKLDLIFEDFTQAESGTTQRYGGTGLGLSIVKKLVDLHAGEIQVNSLPDEGATFICRLPYKKGKNVEAPAESQSAFAIPKAISSLRILVVDDEVYNRKLVGSILNKWGIGFREAGSGEAALDIAGREKFDLVLMDNRMPGMDGLETTRNMRKTIEKDPEQLAIVSFTAATVSLDQKKEYKKAGIHHFLAKPFTEEEFLQLLLNLRGMKPDEIERFEQDSPTEKKTEVTEPDILDLNQLYRVAGGDESFVEEMLLKFIESFDSGYAQMIEGIDQKAYKDAGDAAHKLASPCRHIGADHLLSILKAIEEEAEQEPVHADLRARAEMAGKAYQSVRKRILDHLDERKKSGHAP